MGDLFYRLVADNLHVSEVFNRLYVTGRQNRVTARAFGNVQESARILLGFDQRSLPVVTDLWFCVCGLAAAFGPTLCIFLKMSRVGVRSANWMSGSSLKSAGVIPARSVGNEVLVPSA